MTFRRLLDISFAAANQLDTGARPVAEVSLIKAIDIGFVPISNEEAHQLIEEYYQEQGLKYY